MDAFLVSTSIVALAEIGDKTQLLAFILAAKFRKPLPIVLGILAATLANHAGAGALGAWLTSLVEPETLRWVLGLSFLGMAAWTLIPDEFVVRSSATGQELERRSLPEIAGRKTRAVVERLSMADLFYSFGVTHPGAITLHNYPKHLQSLTRDNGETFDLAAVDILRDRERGVPRYNQFRRLVHKEPVTSFDEVTDNPDWRKQIKQVYGNNIEMVDLMTGLYAEPLPEGFGFSDTAFRIFILMASRRLKSDRFFTDDYGARLYTDFGVDYIRETTMLTLLERHVPEVKPALAGVENAFQPWKARV